VARVQVAVVQIIDVIAMGNRRVAASRTMFVVVMRMLDAVGQLALVPVVIVLVVSMAIVDVVDVVAVHDRHVSAIGAVDVRMVVVAVIVVTFGSVHGSSLALDAHRVWNERVISVVDRLLDATVVGGFSRLGYEIRSRGSAWENFVPRSLSGRRIVVTGPTSGIGRALAGQLADLGARLVLVGRDESRVRRVADELASTGEHEVVVADMSDLQAVARAVERIAAGGVPNFVVHNAGALLHERVITPQGFETTIATHVLAPHLVTRLLASARTIWVSSGGMYGATLPDVAQRDPMSPPKFEGTRQYATAKRMQVTLVEEWASREPTRFFASMHPGWADTPGVRSSLPGFARITSPVLRSADQGADTVTWLCATTSDQPSGRFWCDRETRPIHRLPSTKRSDTPTRRRSLLEWADRLTADWV
jgi:NAD(P)-dependent dehydrogenase (short-subunit alcohol dehydrogenase family)